ncbi:MAG TPA: phosphoribosyltransferase family protein [Candidatus Saccharimonadales bacterium]|nr:phosphoribosyltransferase family protein [Candidatus Saccharimonadales bacterium]
MKQYITPEQLRLESFQLGKQINDSNYKPDFLIAIWRGGAMVGCYVHEMLKYKNITCDHIAIRTSRYEGIDCAKPQVTVYNLGYLLEQIKPDSRILVVDDVFDTGLSIDTLINTLQNKLGYWVNVKIATPYYKPTRNQTLRVPDFYIHTTDHWLVFPHELEGLTSDEIGDHFGQQIKQLL